MLRQLSVFERLYFLIDIISERIHVAGLDLYLSLVPSLYISLPLMLISIFLSSKSQETHTSSKANCKVWPLNVPPPNTIAYMYISLQVSNLSSSQLWGKKLLLDTNIVTCLFDLFYKIWKNAIALVWRCITDPRILRWKGKEIKKGFKSLIYNYQMDQIRHAY